jgi:hypothetical protein
MRQQALLIGMLNKAHPAVKHAAKKLHLWFTALCLMGKTLRLCSYNSLTFGSLRSSSLSLPLLAPASLSLLLLLLLAPLPLASGSSEPVHASIASRSFLRRYR